MPADLQKARSLFLHAVGKLPPEQWDSYVAEACEGDTEVARQLDDLLRLHREAGSFLAVPAAALVGVKPSALERPGTVIGPYKLVEQIGEGGMGMVWRAEQTEPVQRVVALKLIKTGMDSRQVIARFEVERQALALMDHPNIARVLDAGTTEAGRPYFVMDLVQGVPITKYCDEHHLTPRQRLELFVPVCQAVQHAHQKGIIHRDLKPSNVLIGLYDGRPVPKVIDFGVAKATGPTLADRTLITALGNLVGTLEYMSPEQAEADQHDIDTRSDIYSLGVVLYELLTGSPPFSRRELVNAGMLEILRLIREKDPSRPSTRLSSAECLPSLAANRGTDPGKLTRLVRGELDWIVMKALEKDRNRRYETAAGFALDVERYLADEPVAACPPSASYRLRKFVRRNRGPVLAALTLLIMLMALLGTALVSNYQVNNALADRNEAFTKLELEQEKTAAALRRETDALAKRTEALGAKTRALEDLGKAQQETQSANTTLQEALERERQAAYQHRIELAHREWIAGNTTHSLQLLRECPETYRHWEWHFLWRLHHTELMTLSGSGYISDLAYSPDGQRLASTGYAARVWDARSGQLLHTLDTQSKANHRVIFSADGTRLATSAYGGTLRVWDAVTGQQIAVLERPGGHSTNGLAFTPDGRQIVCDEGGPRSSSVKFWDATTGKELSRWQPPDQPDSTGNPLNGVALSPDGKYMAVFGYAALWLVELQTKRTVSLNLYGRGIQRVVFSPDGDRLAACGSGQVRIWQVPSGNVLTTAHYATDIIRGLGFSPDGRSLALSHDHFVHVRDLTAARTTMTLRGHYEVVDAAVFSPNGRQIASAGRDGTIRLWDITAPQQGPRLAGPGPIRRAAFSDDGRRLTAIAPRLQTWDVSLGRTLFSRPFSVASLGVTLSPNGRYLAGNIGSGLHLFEAGTGNEVFAERREKSMTKDLAFSPDGRLLAESMRDGSVQLRDGQTGRLLQSLKAHRGDNTNIYLAFSPDGGRLASASIQPNIKVWDTRDWQELFSWDGHKAVASSVSFSHDSRYLALGTYDKRISVWDATTGTRLFDLPRQADPVTCVTFSPDGKRLFSCGQEGSINVWDLPNRVKLLTLSHRGQFVTISPDGRRLASCNNDFAVQIWESELLTVANRWKQHYQRVRPGPLPSGPQVQAKSPMSP